MAVNDCWHGENWTKLVADDETEIDSMGQDHGIPDFLCPFLGQKMARFDADFTTTETKDLCVSALALLKGVRTSIWEK